MKARLQEADVAFGKTHDLIALLDLALKVESSWEILRADLQSLTLFAVAYRYPGDSADEDDARRIGHTVPEYTTYRAAGVEPLIAPEHL